MPTAAQIHAANPFTLMLDPQTVLDRIEHSERLEALQRRVCRPLDRPLLAKVASADVSAFDSAVDGEGDTPGDEYCAEGN